MNDQILNSDFTTKGILDKLVKEYVPIFTIPKPFHVWCHMCKIGLKSIEDYQKHKETNKHIRNKEIYLSVKN